MNRIIDRLKSKTAKDSVLVLSGNLVSQALSLLVVIVIGRFLSVAEYGVYSVLNNISSFITDMADMGMNGAITRFVAEYRGKGEIDKEHQLINYSIHRKTINLVIVFTILIICARPIAEYWLHNASLYRYIYIIIVTCGFTLFVSALKAVLQGRQEFNKYFISTIMANSVWCGSIIIMALTNRISVFSSILSNVVSGAVNLFLCIFLVKVDENEIRKNRIIDSELKKKFNAFGLWMLLWSVFAILQSKLDVFMLATFTTSEQVSYYDIASKVIKPILMVVSAYAQVLNPQLASMDSTKLKAKIKTVAKFILIVSVMIVFAILAVRPLITLVFRNKYDNAIIPAQLLLFAIIFFVWTIPFNSALYALNKPYIFSMAAFVGLVVTAIGDYLLLGKYGAIGAAYTYIAAQIVGLIIALGAYILIVIRRKGGNVGI